MSHVFEFQGKPAAETMRHRGIPVFDIRHLLLSWNEYPDSTCSCPGSRHASRSQEARSVQQRRIDAGNRHVGSEEGAVLIQRIVRHAEAATYDGVRSRSWRP